MESIQVDPDFLEAIQIAALLFGLCLSQNLERSTVDLTVQELLKSNTPLFEPLTETQRLRVWQICQTVLNRVYEVEE